MTKFELISDYKPKGDQPQAIEKLIEGVKEGYKYQTLLGVTGSGKTFTMANIIQAVQKPTLVLAHNKTLTAQLYSEFKEFFPHNAVEYFVSYYDYYQPEAYLPHTDTYIEKDYSISEELDKLRLSTTHSVVTRRDVIVVASVSCIYGLGPPEDYMEMNIPLAVGTDKKREEILHELTLLQYERNDIDFSRGTFRARGDVVEIFPAYADSAFRVELFGDYIERIVEFDPLTGEILREVEEEVIYPASHYATPQEKLERAVRSIEKELEEQLKEIYDKGWLVEAQRLEQRVKYDIEMLREMGYCQGIENYSRHLSGRAEGEPPFCLIDYFPDDYLFFIDESHVTIPQVNGMWAGDRSRKNNLVRYGFRLPSAYDNRPLNFEEFEKHINQVIFTSATPGPYELEKSKQIVEQLVRPTGLTDPEVEVKPTESQIDDLLLEIEERVKRNERILVTTLTKRMAEDLTDYMAELGVKVRYLHSEIDTLDRVEILRDLRLGEFDVLVGINLLREGLDLPEVSLVAILDADKEGFLRAERSLIQTMGRAARNINGKVILYADRMTNSMQRAIDETNRRRKVQMEFNRKHNITPRTITKSIRDLIETTPEADPDLAYMVREAGGSYLVQDEIASTIDELEKEMKEAARRLEFERAAELRDLIAELKGTLDEAKEVYHQTKGKNKRRRHNYIAKS